MKATVKDVAERAGVSLGSVSRVLNGAPTAGDAVTARVRRAIEELGYRPLRRRKRAAVGRSLCGRSVGLVLLGMHKSLVSLPSVANAVEGAEAMLSAAGALTVLYNIPDPASLPGHLGRSPVDALILKGAMQGRVLASAADSLLQRMESPPVAWMLGRPDGCRGDSVAPDDLAVGRMAAEYLVSRNHRHLAFLNPKPDHVLFVRRQMSFEWHARQLDATVGRFLADSPNLWQLPLHPVESVQTVQTLLRQLLDSRPQPTAVFCPADSITRQLYKACAIGGIEPGRDLSIISASFEDASAMLHPSLTSIDIHPDAVGRRTVELLEWRLAHPDEPEVQITIAPSLVEGQSVQTLPSQGTD